MKVKSPKQMERIRVVVDWAKGRTLWRVGIVVPFVVMLMLMLYVRIDTNLEYRWNAGGYQSVSLKSDFPIDDTVLMGQFNYRKGVEDVILWHHHWKAFFNRIVIHGPFSDDQIAVLRIHGISVHQGKGDGGHVSPVANLQRTLMQYKYVEGVKGVMFAESDALINVTNLLPLLGSETNIIVTDEDVENPRSVTEHSNRWKKVVSSSFSIHPDGTLSKIDGFLTTNFLELERSLVEWQAWKECIPGYMRVSQDFRSRKYSESDGSILAVGGRLSDFLYMPTSLAREYANAAQIMVDQNVYRECAFPKIVDMLRQTANATVSSADLCTLWDQTRDSSESLTTCGQQAFPLTVLNPFKLETHSVEEWTKAFRWMSTSTEPFELFEKKKKK